MLQDGYKLSPLNAYTCPDEGSLEEVRSLFSLVEKSKRIVVLAVYGQIVMMPLQGFATHEGFCHRDPDGLAQTSLGNCR